MVKVCIISNGRMNHFDYMDVLDEADIDFLPAEIKFQQDNAPIYKANDVMIWLENNKVNVLGEWPPYSPDLSPIENIWLIIKLRMARNTRKPFLNLVYSYINMYQLFTISTYYVPHNY